MSEVARQARDVLARVIGDRPVDIHTVQAALADIQVLRPLDAYDEAVIHEAGETVLRLIETIRAAQ